MKDYTSNTPEFSEHIQILEATDPVHADNVNVSTEQLLQNTLCNHQMIEKMHLSGRDIVVPAASWSGSAAPYTVDITLQGAASDSTVYVLPHPDITPVQYKALAEAAIIGGDQGEGTVRLKAYGTKPTVDLPLRFLVSGIEEGGETE